MDSVDNAGRRGSCEAPALSAEARPNACGSPIKMDEEQQEGAPPQQEHKNTKEQLQSKRLDDGDTTAAATSTHEHQLLPRHEDNDLHIDAEESDLTFNFTELLMMDGARHTARATLSRLLDTLSILPGYCIPCPGWRAGEMGCMRCKHHRAGQLLWGLGPARGHSYEQSEDSCISNPAARSHAVE
eukprot:2568164-Pyramimonas_sp.AAC.4